MRGSLSLVAEFPDREPVILSDIAATALGRLSGEVRGMGRPGVDLRKPDGFSYVVKLHGPQLDDDNLKIFVGRLAQLSLFSSVHVDSNNGEGMSLRVLGGQYPIRAEDLAYFAIPFGLKLRSMSMI
jgi:hypothetical protein